jgi:DNA-binding SARP family transcriptional activator
MERASLSTSLRIALLGGFQLSYGDTLITTVSTPRLQALLAYLALRPGVAQSRQQVAFLLWPDSTDAQARTNLRTLLHRLRAGLPDADLFLAGDAQSVWWRPDAPFTLDVIEFEAALTDADRARQAGEEIELRAALERAAELYQGDLLPDCYDDWAQAERDRLQQLAIDALERLVERLELQRDHAPAIDYARRLLRLDSLRESTHADLMRLHAARGDRAGALRAYHACAAALRDELGLEPGPSIRAAYEHLLAADAAPPAVTAHASRVPLVGRAVEWARAQAAWQAAAAGRLRLLVLAGEAGIGKTRLAEDLLAWSGRQGNATAVARCYAAEGELAYAPATEWLRSDALRRRLARLEPVWLSEVARLAPDVLDGRPNIPHPGPLTERWQRRRLFEALARAVLAGERPLLLLIDDLQWCDHDTLEWLHFLLRYEPRACLLIVGTLRAEEVGPDHPLTPLLDDLRRSDQLTEIALGPLGQPEIATLAGHMASRPLPDAAVAKLYAETEGHPLFVVELMRARSEQLELQDSRSGAGHQPLAHLQPLPPGIQAVIAHRLGQIGPAARELLCVAAVIGRMFGFGVLARAAEASEDMLVRALDELWQRRIIREQGAEAYDFSHDKLRAVVYDGLSAARRRVLHRRVAAALEAEHTAALDTVSAQIASHYERAALANQAVAYYRRAAAVAQRVYANAEAIGYLRRALDLVAASSAPLAVTLNDQLGDLLHLAGQYADAREAYQRGLDGTTESERRDRSDFHRKIGNTWRDQYNYEAAFLAYEAAKAALGAESHETDAALWQAWTQIQMERMQAHYWLAQAPEMFQLIEQSRPIVERYGSPQQRARIYQFLALASIRRDRYVISAEVVGYAHAHLAALEEAGDTQAYPAARFQLGISLLWHSDLAAAEEHMLAALAAAERTGDVSLEARCLTYLTIVYRKRNDADAVRAYAERSLHIATAGQMPDYIGAAHANMAWLAWRAGDLAEVRTRGQQALESWRGTSHSFGSQWTVLWPLLGAALTEQRVAEAVECARALLDQQQQRLPAALEAALEAAIRAADIGDLAAARAEFERALGPARDVGYL